MPAEAETKPREERRRKRARFNPGDVISERYRVLSAWGAGRLDEAYKVEDQASGNLVLLKVLRRTRHPYKPSRELLRAFDRLARLDHPNVARVLDLSVHAIPDVGYGNEWVLFVASELVEGEQLSSYVRNTRPLDMHVARTLIDDVCAGLAAAHAARVVHGNLSGAAVVLCRNGDSLRAVITDFAPSATDDEFHFGRFGPPVYKAPETIVGMTPDLTSDVFSLGAIIYEILSGRLPFTGGNLLALDFRRLEEEPRRLGELVDNLPPQIEPVVSRCLSRGREDRYTNAGEVRKALTGRDYWTPRTRRNVSTLSAAAALVAIMLGGSAMLDRLTELELARLPVLSTSTYRPSVAILDLASAGSSTKPWVATALSELLRQEFRHDSSTRVSEDRLVHDLCGLTEPQMSVPDAELTAQLRALFDIELVVSGTCSVDPTAGVPAVAVDLCVVDARSGETIAAAFERGSPESLPELAARAASRLRVAIGLDEPSSSTVRWDPDAVRPWAEGLIMAKNHRAREALERLEAAASVQPGNPQIQDALTSTWMEIGHVTRAVDSARRSVDVSRNDSPEDSLDRMATLAVLEGDVAKAIAIRARLARAFPDQSSHAYSLISTLLRAGATKEANAEIERLRASRATVDPRTEIMDARLNAQLGRFEAARAHAERAHVIASALDSSALIGDALIERAWAEAGLGNPQTAWTDLLEAERILTSGNHLSGLTKIDSIRATLLTRNGELDAAMEAYFRLRERYTALGQEQSSAATIGSQATIRSLQGRHAEAIVLLDDAISRFQSLGDAQNVVRSVALTGDVYLALGRLNDATESYSAAAASARELDLQAWEGWALTGLAHVAIEQLELDVAEQRVKEASSIFGELSMSGSTAGLDIAASQIDSLRGNSTKARNRLLANLSRVSDYERLTELRRALASIALASGNVSEALALSTDAATQYELAGKLDRRVDCLTIALFAASRLHDDIAGQSAATQLESALPSVESRQRILRARLALASLLDNRRAQEQRQEVFTRSDTAGLLLLRMEAASELQRHAAEPRERERWKTEVSSMVQASGATRFLEPSTER